MAASVNWSRQLVQTMQTVWRRCPSSGRFSTRRRRNRSGSASLMAITPPPPPQHWDCSRLGSISRKSFPARTFSNSRGSLIKPPRRWILQASWKVTEPSSYAPALSLIRPAADQLGHHLTIWVISIPFGTSIMFGGGPAQGIIGMAAFGRP